MAEAREDRDRYERKHDEMFQAVSGLNGRIEELEQHKLELQGKTVVALLSELAVA